MPFPELMQTGSGGDSAAGLYLRPTWMEFDPAQRMAQAIQFSRQAKDRESQDFQGQQNTKFEQGRELNKDDLAAQEWQMKVKDAAENQAREGAYRAKIQGIQSNPNLTPEQKSQGISMAFLESFAGSPGTSQGTGQALRALNPPPKNPPKSLQAPYSIGPNGETIYAPGSKVVPATQKHIPVSVTGEPNVVGPSVDQWGSPVQNPLARMDQAWNQSVAPAATVAPTEPTVKEVDGIKFASLDGGKTWKIVPVGRGTGATGSHASTTTNKSKSLDKTKAAEFLKQANGDKDKARKLAHDAGYTF